MKTLPVFSLVSYLTTVGGGAGWRQMDYATNKMVKCLKGEAVKGYFDVSVAGKVERFDDGSRERFVDVLCMATANKLGGLMQGDFTLVPVPNSSAVQGEDAGFRTEEIAGRVAGRLGLRASVSPVLRWKRAMLSSRKGGTRDAQVLCDNLHLGAKPGGAVVLFDDVLTTGAHMIACWRKLVAADVVPVLGVAIGRTTLNQKPKMVEWTEEAIPVEAPVHDWDLDDF